MTRNQILRVDFLTEVMPSGVGANMLRLTMTSPGIHLAIRLNAKIKTNWIEGCYPLYIRSSDFFSNIPPSPYPNFDGNGIISFVGQYNVKLRGMFSTPWIAPDGFRDRSLFPRIAFCNGEIDIGVGRPYNGAFTQCITGVNTGAGGVTPYTPYGRSAEAASFGNNGGGYEIQRHTNSMCSVPGVLTDWYIPSAPATPVFPFTLSLKNVTYGAAVLPYVPAITVQLPGLHASIMKLDQSDMPVFSNPNSNNESDLSLYTLLIVDPGYAPKKTIKIGLQCFCASEDEFVERQIRWTSSFGSIFFMNGQAIGQNSPYYTFTPNTLGFSIHVISIIPGSATAPGNLHITNWSTYISECNMPWPDVATGFGPIGDWELDDQIPTRTNGSGIDLQENPTLYYQRNSEDLDRYKFSQYVYYNGTLGIEQGGIPWEAPVTPSSIDTGIYFTYDPLKHWGAVMPQYYDYSTGELVEQQDLDGRRLQIGKYRHNITATIGQSVLKGSHRIEAY
jgi:hypothetical protein